MTPSARALTDLRKDGYVPWVVEATIRHFKRDLFNCIDILAIKGEVTLAVQVTAGSAHANRVTKVRESEYLPLMLGAGWQVEVWSYRKSASGKWVRRTERIKAECTYCREYFSRWQCGANRDTGECDCPKCQGICECSLTIGID